MTDLPIEQLTPQQVFDQALDALPMRGRVRRLVLEYLKDLNGKRAAIRAGYSEKTAEVQASQTLRNLKVRAAINAGVALKAMGSDEVLARLGDHARGSLADFLRLSPNGDLHGFDLSDDKPLHLLKKASVTKRTIKDMTEETVTIELYDAQAALALLGRHHKLFTDKTEHTENLNVGDLTDDQLDALIAAKGRSRA